MNIIMNEIDLLGALSEGAGLLEQAKKIRGIGCTWSNWVMIQPRSKGTLSWVSLVAKIK